MYSFFLSLSGSDIAFSFFFLFPQTYNFPLHIAEQKNYIFYSIEKSSWQNETENIFSLFRPKIIINSLYLTKFFCMISKEIYENLITFYIHLQDFFEVFISGINNQDLTLETYCKSTKYRTSLKS